MTKEKKWYYYIFLYDKNFIETENEGDYVLGERRYIFREEERIDDGVPVGNDFSVAYPFIDMESLHRFAKENGLSPEEYCVRGFFE